MKRRGGELLDELNLRGGVREPSFHRERLKSFGIYHNQSSPGLSRRWQIPQIDHSVAIQVGRHQGQVRALFKLGKYREEAFS